MDILDLIHRARLAADSSLPSMGTVSSMLTGPLGLALSHAALAQAGVMNNHPTTMVPAAPPQATPQDIAAQSGALSIPPSAVVSPPKPPPVEAGFPYAPSTPNPWQTMAQASNPMNWAQGSPSGSPIPLPQPRPQQAPGVNPNGSIAGAVGPTSVNGAPRQPQMNWFQRNAAMMTDPITGQPIDPSAAAQAQQSQNGSSLIDKMMGYLKQNGGAGSSNASSPYTNWENA